MKVQREEAIGVGEQRKRRRKQREKEREKKKGVEDVDGGKAKRKSGVGKM